MSGEESHYILTISCPDAVGIVAAVAGLLAAENLFITESHHFGDPVTKRFFMRTVFHPVEVNAFGQKDFATKFEPVARRFEMEWHLHNVGVRPSFLLMVSRADHCLNDLLYRYRTGTLPIHIPAIVSNHLDLAPLAQQHRIPFFHIPVARDNKVEAERRLLELVEETKAEFVVLARYMQVLSDETCRALAGRAVNIHHSFLPSFKGAKPYHQAHERGVKLIGATAHFVTSDLDEGPIIEQRVEPVTHTTTVEQMIAAGRDVEALVLARAVAALAGRRVFLNGKRTVVFGG
ncbi:formyltetrahydrofolate deformylase [Parvibaculum sp.]|uniref:formyltetrahydrofolate deformylase n=1 Tax=Parvibaculum sp. TaxID=2024848 RepID=UPI002B692335|nr:formyltetrahydrofolate deformylase [Parvibaculum sp.]HUD53255.1 formyltetrahydrofolate deformylase [Parvibaculum sp.]